MLKRALAVALALASSTAEAKSIPDPVVTVCPASTGDLEFAVYSMMTSAKFQQDGSRLSWRRRFDGPFHLLSMEPAQYLHVDFLIFRTSAGTQLVAQPRWRTSKYEFGVDNPAVVDLFKQSLDLIAEHFPC